MRTKINEHTLTLTPTLQHLHDGNVGTRVINGVYQRRELFKVEAGVLIRVIDAVQLSEECLTVCPESERERKREKDNERERGRELWRVGAIVLIRSFTRAHTHIHTYMHTHNV